MIIMNLLTIMRLIMLIILNSTRFIATVDLQKFLQFLKDQVILKKKMWNQPTPLELVHFVLANQHLQWTVPVHISHITIVTIVIQMRLINYFIFMQFNMVCTFWCSFLIASLMSNLKNMMNESESWRIPALNWKLLIFHVYFISGVILYCGLDLENLW